MENDSTLLARAARVLLDANFEPSVQPDLLEEIGLDLVPVDFAESPIPGTVRRDPKFRSLILVAYEYRCAMCGFDPQVDNVPVAIDAAHVRWWVSFASLKGPPRCQ
jgi:putative restriction endonuclease